MLYLVCALHRLLLKWFYAYFQPSVGIGTRLKRACDQCDSNAMATKWLMPPHLHMEQKLINNMACSILRFAAIVWLLLLVEIYTRSLHRNHHFGSCLGLQVCKQLSCHEAYKPKPTLCRLSTYQHSFFFCFHRACVLL